VIDVLRHHDVRKQPLAGERLLDGLRGHWRFHHAVVIVGARVFGAYRLIHDEARRLVLQLLGDRLTDPQLRVAARTLLVGLGHVDLEATARQVCRQRATSRRPATQMAAHRRVTRIHLNGLGHRPRFIGELLEREL
jgi:hypothetical protein